jgi:predicted enzyme related to lactoylglutathione lyase
MTSGIATVLYPASDPSATKAVITALLGVEPHTDEPYYVGWNVAGQEIGINPSGDQQGLTGATPFWAVEDIEARLQQLVAAGATVVQPASAVGGGRRVASVVDANGNAFGLLQDS